MPTCAIEDYAERPLCFVKGSWDNSILLFFRFVKKMMGQNAKIITPSCQDIAHNQTIQNAVTMVGNQYDRAISGNVDQGNAFDIKA